MLRIFFALEWKEKLSRGRNWIFFFFFVVVVSHGAGDETIYQDINDTLDFIIRYQVVSIVSAARPRIEEDKKILCQSVTSSLLRN